jgi:diguanylate cyclase (GGDEF)-like protein
MKNQYNNVNSTGLPGGVAAKKLTVLVYDKDEIGRWLLGTYLALQTEREVYSRETDQISQVKIAVERGEVDLVVLAIDTPDELQYWIDSIDENQQTPLLLLVENMTDAMEKRLQERAVLYIHKNRLSRDELSQGIDTALKKWEKLKQSAIHKEELDKIANFDQLTGVLNRRAILNKLEECISQSRRYNVGLSLLLLDIDRFESVIETYDKKCADLVVFRIASLVETRTRDTDFVGRYGRDELLVVLPHTEINAAEIAAERLRKNIEALEIDIGYDKPCRVTVSGGLAGYEAGDDFATLTYKAENSLCNAKANGRNRIEK